MDPDLQLVLTEVRKGNSQFGTISQRVDVLDARVDKHSEQLAAATAACSIQCGQITNSLNEIKGIVHDMKTEEIIPLRDRFGKLSVKVAEIGVIAGMIGSAVGVAIKSWWPWGS